jgi:hypothetical protein
LRDFIRVNSRSYSRLFVVLLRLSLVVLH